MLDKAINTKPTQSQLIHAAMTQTPITIDGKRYEVVLEFEGTLTKADGTKEIIKGREVNKHG